ncbi:complement C4-B [Lampris incognitus]|uniref:complement C4-B n=1 Tax=Lampris incognitus TaxID=2546036 RepID=UPI0024B55BB2|nr:complement C4-B [Lampris incognitus]
MKCSIFFKLFLILSLDCVRANDRFFISAPSVFHLGVKEKVYVQMGGSLSSTDVELYLEHEDSGTLMSEKKSPVDSPQGGLTKTAELMIDVEKMLRLPPFKSQHPYLLLVVESKSFPDRRVIRVLVSKHRGYIFIQTHQPAYNPTQTVEYRIFTLDHTLRPHEEHFELSIFNAAGNRIMKQMNLAMGGIYSGILNIPDVAELGTWKIVANYENDDRNATREFKVQKFVLPSFEVVIRMEESYLLLNSKQLSFNIVAKYSFGKNIRGAYHCRFGVVFRDSDATHRGKPVFIRGLELVDSITDGKAEVTLITARLNDHLRNQLGKTLSDLEKFGAELYITVSVAEIQSGELQEAEVSIPIAAQAYTIDFSRTRSFFIPGVPLDVVVAVRLPNGSPASEIPVEIRVPLSEEKVAEVQTNQQGTVFALFNFHSTGNSIEVKVNVKGQEQKKVIQRASSPSGKYLYINFASKVYTVGESLTIQYHTVNSEPKKGCYLYYMVLSRGVLVKHGSLEFGITTRHRVEITSDMVPSFRLIAYYYSQDGDIIADSVWVDVKDECEKKIRVSTMKNQYDPGKHAEIKLDVDGQKAKVALLVVDKAMYALHTQNKLTAEQVFSSMQSYDLGCSYVGGSDTVSTLSGAGLAFLSHSQSTTSVERKGYGCESHAARRRRSLDIQQALIMLKSNFSKGEIQDCCVRGYSLIPMRKTCQERAKRVSQVNADPACIAAFLQCCHEGEKLRERKRKEQSQDAFGRTASASEIEEFFFDSTTQYIRRYFPPSFEFKIIDVNNIHSHTLYLPDSITTWEIQAVAVSATHGFCVAEPHEIKAFKEVFVSLKLPYTVKKYEQISIAPVIYNYGENEHVQLAVHMEQTAGLCSPGSATSTTFVNITVAAQSSQHVTFSAVPMVSGPVLIKIRLYGIENERGIDAIEKILNVWTEGIQHRTEETLDVRMKGRNEVFFTIDGKLPDSIVPNSISNIFAKMEGSGFGKSSAYTLLSSEGVDDLIKLPSGCAEQTMKLMAPTALALRYLDKTRRWFELPPGTRDKALQNTEKGYARMVNFQYPDGSYGIWPWQHKKPSHWLTGLVVKVLSLVAEGQSANREQQGRRAVGVSNEAISLSVHYLLSVQLGSGAFNDPHPVIDRQMQGGVGGKEVDVSMTAFITLALQHSLQFLDEELKTNTKASISRATTYLLSHMEELKGPYTVAIAAYCLSVCLAEKAQASPAWEKLKTLSTEVESGCRVWRANREAQNAGKLPADAITVETTAYALLTAVQHEDFELAEKAACWLTTQENYGGGFKSTQDTIVTLEALAEYDLKRPSEPFTKVEATFTVPGRSKLIQMSLENEREKVETELKRLIGNSITVQLRGEGNIKLKVVKAYHLLEPKDSCEKLSIRVTVEGKVQYTAKVIQNYDYYDEDYSNDEAKEERVPRSAIEWFDARSRSRRHADHGTNTENDVNYNVCVSHSLRQNLSGMAIADITLLSGFEAQIEDLEQLKQPTEQYISHYEISKGRVLIYFDKIVEQELCITFGAIQTVKIGLLQPAPALFYDYYEPNRKCTVFYSAPERSKMVSKLCSGDVCQCAERPCHKEQSVFAKAKDQKRIMDKRSQHACFLPTVDYAFIVEVLNVSVKSNFKLYTTNVTKVLKAYRDVNVTDNSVRVFAKRLQCNGELLTDKQYLIMGKDGSTTDSNGEMQYLLESNTWVEQNPGVKCGTAYRMACKMFHAFVSTFQTQGCTQ